MGRIYQKLQKPNLKPNTDNEYSRFEKLNGWHQWQEKTTESFVLYPVRKLNAGKVVYFNFDLAKEMGLIAKSHEEKLNKKLEQKILDTFSIRIVNEYDQENNVTYHPSVMKPLPYMATRYLQLQHKNKKGTTSGDGRSIWNGQIQFNGKTWDVGSRGTGVTKLSPGSVEAKKPLKSGSEEFGYGCGLADLDELIGAAMLAEIFHNNNVSTERVLAVIDLGDGNGIGVRAGLNLFRPAHLFNHLKQENLEALQKATDFIIERQYQNGLWSISPRSRQKYSQMLTEISERYAQFTAQLDREYIFTWLDWDGDNVLIDAGIIDYGSIRQFGLRHDEYRYDDVDRFSTNLKEQFKKARLIVQVFAQLTDYLKTGRKKPLRKFERHWAVKKFNSDYRYYLLDQFLFQMGLPKHIREHLLLHTQSKVKNLFEAFSKLESYKTRRRSRRVSDGVNRPAILNMRVAFYELIGTALNQDTDKKFSPLSPTKFFQMVLAEGASGKDRKITPKLKKLIQNFQYKYFGLLSDVISLSKTDNVSEFLKNAYSDAFEANRPYRVTGDGLLYVVDEILNFYKKEPDSHSIQIAIDKFIRDQSPTHKSKDKAVESRLHSHRRAHSLFESILSLVDGHRESI